DHRRAKGERRRLTRGIFQPALVHSRLKLIEGTSWDGNPTLTLGLGTLVVRGWDGEVECCCSGEQGGHDGVQDMVTTSAILFEVSEVEPGRSLLELVDQFIECAAAVVALVASVRQVPVFESCGRVYLDDQSGSSTVDGVAL